MLDPRPRPIRSARLPPSWPDPPDAATPLRLRGAPFARRLMTLAQPRMVLIGAFLSAAECAQLRAQALPRLARAQVVIPGAGAPQRHAVRSNEAMFFDLGETALVRRIEARIAALLHWPAARAEGLQVLRYAQGTEYRPHIDHFDPGLPGSAELIARGGQRVGTLLMYLNTPAHGGATVFPELGLEVMPVQGQALYFGYGDAPADGGVLHGGAPVIEGEKWVATKWLCAGGPARGR